MPSKVREGGQRGWLVPIGGSEDKTGDTVILKRFAELCGGEKAHIAIIPAASRLADIGQSYEAIFRDLGVGQAETLDFDTRRDAEEPGRLERLRKATGIFFTGGSQLRIATRLGGTPVAKLVRELNAAGVPVGGTSAGASILSDHMIVSGRGGGTPTASRGRLAPGLGLSNRLVIDQHFRQRDRLGRLMAALSYNPYLIGLGVDEDTAAFISPDGRIEVEGSGAVTVVDAGDLQFTSMAQAEGNDPLCMLGLTVHVLIPGARFDLDARRASAGDLIEDEIDE